MQKKRGQKAQAMNSSELAACMDHAILPTTLQQYCDAHGVALGSRQFDDLCKAFAERIGLGDLWYLILYPFTLSADNCQKHPWIRRRLLQPRITKQEWDRLEAKLERSEDKYLRRQAIKLGRKEIGVTAPEELCQQFGELLLETRYGKDGRRQPLKDYERTHGLPYKMRRLRKMMITDPWLRLVFPHQWMPLTPITPDIHQPIEHRVHELKLDTAKAVWKLLKDGEDAAALMLARTYQEIIIRSAKQRSDEKGRQAIKGSIRRMRKLLHVLKAGTDESVALLKVIEQRDGTECVEFVLQQGTGGAWAPNRLS